jgi:protein-disulfide isomerase
MRRLRSGPPRGVYTIALAALAALAPAVALAQVELTVNPAMVQGPPTARVTIVEFADYQCQHCRSVQASLKQIMTEYDGRVRIIAKDFPLRSHALAWSAAEAARCAAELGQYWPYRDRLFERQPAFAREQLIEYATELGLDAERFRRCVDERRFAAAVQTDVEQARALGVHRTPTFLVNGRVMIGTHPVETFREVIDGELRRR